MTNPYAPPATPEAHGTPHANDARDGADLFIDSLPPPLLKAAAVAWFATSAMVAFFALHIWVDLRMTAVMEALGVVHVALALGSFGVGLGLLRGRITLAVVGFAVTPFLLLACLAALFTGALAGLVGIGLVLVAPALTAASLRSIARVGEARALLATRRGSTPDGSGGESLARGRP